MKQDKKSTGREATENIHIHGDLKRYYLKLINASLRNKRGKYKTFRIK